MAVWRVQDAAAAFNVDCCERGDASPGVSRRPRIIGGQEHLRLRTKIASPEVMLPIEGRILIHQHKNFLERFDRLCVVPCAVPQVGTTK